MIKTGLNLEKNDLDNFIKPIIDALTEISIIKEVQIAQIKIQRIKVSIPKCEGVEIKIFKYVSENQTCIES